MYRKNINTKHFSLAVTFALFILAMASIVVLSKININKDSYGFDETNYTKIETINPLVLENSKQQLNKKDANVKLIDEIKRVYNLDILYGDGTNYLADSVSAKALYDEEDVNILLHELIECLDKYPSNIFKEIKLKDYTVEICLIDYFNNDNIALATRDSNNNFKIYISNSNNSQKIKKSIHHETYHVLEYYMKLEFDINELYKDWNKYNPQDFVYQEDVSLLNEKYVFDLDKEGKAYFVSVYSKVSEKEDRAEVFCDTMMAKEKPLYYTDDIGAIKGKINLISYALRECFYSVEYSHIVYWTRYFEE